MFKSTNPTSDRIQNASPMGNKWENHHQHVDEKDNHPQYMGVQNWLYLYPKTYALILQLLCSR